MKTVHRRKLIWYLVAIVSLVACSPAVVAPSTEDPATVEEISGSELSRITLSARAVERLGIETAPVERELGGLTMPYSALLYDSEGRTWTYTNPEPNVFVRHELVVDRIEGDVAVIEDGPPEGTAVVTIGAAELFGTETGVGGGH
jgi:hypothetical protein